MVVVAGGMITLLAFGAIALDVGYMHLTRARAEAAARAAARAGYEHLKKVDFQLAANKDDIEDRMREYLEANGVANNEAIAADIDIERCGEIDVSVRLESKVYLGVFAGLSPGDVNVQGSIDMECNKVAPFAVPSTYQDPDQDGYSNWDVDNEKIVLTPTPWEWKVGNPYIIKFGRDSGVQGDNSNWVFVPMDDKSVTVSLDSGAFTLDSQDFAGTLTSNSTDSGIGWDFNTRKTKKCNVGVLRAYGLAYDVAGVSNSSLFWALGYHGGSFIMRAQDLDAAGYQIPTPGTGNFVIQEDSGTTTHIKAQMLYANTADPNYDPAHKDFVNKLSELSEDGDIKMLQIEGQPKILTFTEGNDAVTSTMINAGIPFRATYFDKGSGFFSFALPTSGSSTGYLTLLRDPTGVNNGPFDWLHLHHENFASSESGTPYPSQELVEAIYEFMRTEHRFIFAACWAAETLDMALARLGSPHWTAEEGVSEFHLADHMANADQEIRYDKTLAFTDFAISEGSDVYDDQDYDGLVPNEKFTSDEGDTGCSPNAIRGCFEDSEIDSEYQSEFIHRPGVNYPSWSRNNGNYAAARAVFADYLNPLTQSHGGYLGREYDEASESVAPYDSGDFIDTEFGATNSFRYHGSPWTHCDRYTDTGEEITTQPLPQHNWGLNTLYEGLSYDDPRHGDRQWIDENRVGRDLDGSGDLGHVRLKDLVGIMCGPNPCATPNGTDRYLIGDINLDGNNSYCPGPYGYNQGLGVCYNGYTNRYRQRDRTSYARVDENDDGFVCYGNPHNHTIMKPHIVAGGGITEPSAVPGVSPDTNMMILSRDINNANPTDLSNIQFTRYLSGILDNNSDLTDGYGRWSYLGGHDPDRHASGDTVSGRGLLGMRTYLNNILFGSTAVQSSGGTFTPSTGAINPAGLGLGGDGGSFGAGGATGNSFRTMFRVGSKGIGLPIGAKFQTAPGNFTTQTTDGLNFAFDDGTGTPDSSTWNEFVAWRVGKTPEEVSEHPQVFVVPVVERIPGGATAPAIPTPQDELDDWLRASSSPSAGANDGADTSGAGGARELSMYAGNPSVDQDDPSQARNLHVIGFKEFFIIDKDNQAPTTQDSTDASVNDHFVAQEWKDGEIRGYLIREVALPPSETIFPPAPGPDTRTP